MKIFFKKHTKKILIFLFTIGVYSLFVLYSSAQSNQNNEPQQDQQPVATNADNANTDIGREVVSDILLSDFEDAEDWVARATSPLGNTELKRILQRGEIIDSLEGYQFNNQQKDNFENNIMGVKTYFADKGFDRVEVKPLYEYILRGDVKSISFWTLGRNFKHNVYVKLRSYKNQLHLLKLGDLGYFGWRKLSVIIPGWFPQSARYSLLDKNTHFVSLVVESNHFEPRGQYYFYFDYLVARVNKSVNKYPGSEIKDTW